MNALKTIRKIEYWDRIGRPDYYFNASDAVFIRNAIARSLEVFFTKLKEI